MFTQIGKHPVTSTVAHNLSIANRKPNPNLTQIFDNQNRP